MKFLCPNCKAKYQIADEKVAGRTLRMDCRRCGNNITIRADMAIDDAEDAPVKPAAALRSAPGSAAVVASGAARPRPAGATLGTDFQRSVGRSAPPTLEPRPTPLDQWHVAINDVPVGPLRREEISKKIAVGAVTADSLCWREGLDDWRPMRDVPELAALLRRSITPEQAPRGSTAARPLGAGPPRASAPMGARPSPLGAQRPAARSNVVPIGGRLGGAAAPALEDDGDLETDEPTRVGGVDVAELEARALADSAARQASERAEAKRVDDVFPDVKRAPAAKSTAKAGTPLPGGGLSGAPLPKPGRSEAKPAAPAAAPKPARPAPEIVAEPELAIDEPSFADVPERRDPTPVPLLAPAARPVAVAPAAKAAAAPSVAPRPAERDERRGGLPVGAWIAIAGATAFGAVMAYMIGTRVLAPVPTAPAVVTVQPTTPPPTVIVPPPTAEVAAPPETPPEVAEAPPATAPVAEQPPTTTTAATPSTTTTARPHSTGSAGSAGTSAGSATSAGAQAATKTTSTAATGRFAEFEDDSSGPAQIATTGRRSIADDDTVASTRGQQELTADQIRAVITRERPAVNRCWETELRRLGQAATVRLDVDLTIGGSGTVTSVSTRGQSVGTLSDCIERNVRRWRFPAVSGSTQTSFPLVFTGT